MSSELQNNEQPLLMGLRDVARMMGVHPNTASRYIAQYEDAGVLKHRGNGTGKRWLRKAVVGVIEQELKA